jgi:hypothetical protein
VPFPEATVLTRLREVAQQEGADIIQLTTPARLVRDAKSESGIRVVCEGNQITCKVAIAAAGAGNWPLLKGLEVEPAMKLRQTPLLVLHNHFATDIQIFADRVRGFSFVRHPPDSARLPKGALVVGTRVDRLVQFQPPDNRRIDPEDREEFRSLLPPILEASMPDGRFTAGYEVIPDAKYQRKDIEPWIEWVEGFPALLQAMPGRATMGMLVARQVLAELTSRIGEPDTTRPAYEGIGMPWVEPISMHYHMDYDFDDSK